MLKFLASPVTVEIEQVPEPPFVFQLIRQASGTSLAEMYKVFNMGIRMMLFVDAQAAEAICDLLNPFGVRVHILGEVRRATQDALVNIHTGDPSEPRIIYQ